VQFRARTPLVGAFAIVGAASCRLLFGVDDLTGGVLPAGGALDAGAPSDADSPTIDCDAQYRLCACSHHDFCDDFDTPEPLGQRWKSPLPEPFSKNDGGLALTDAASSGPGAIVTTVSELQAPGYAFLSHALVNSIAPGRVVGGILLGVDIRVGSLELLEVSGPVPDHGSAVVSAIGSVTPPSLAIGGVALVFSSDGVYLFASRDLLEAKRDASATPDDVLLPLPLGKFRGISSWFRFELLIATRSVALREGFSICSTVADGLVVAAGVGGGLGQVCAVSPPSFGNVSTAFDVVAGAALYGGGNVIVGHDSVTVDVFDP
jgi:hypothetical protein